MNTEDLFQMALGIVKPWEIVNIEFSEEAQRLDLWLDFKKGSGFDCPVCHDADCKVYDTEDRTWRHLNFFQHETFLHARQPRIDCTKDGVKTIEVPWARPGTGFTLLMEAFIMVLAQHGMTAQQIGKIVGEHDTRIWRVLKYYVEESRQKADFSKVKVLGIDETSQAKGHNYVTVFSDLEEKQVLFVTPGKDQETLTEFCSDLESHKGSPNQIRQVCMDMSKAYISGVKTHLPKASITFDAFHLMQIINKALNEVRHQEFKIRPELKGSRFVWLKNEWNQSEEQRNMLRMLLPMKLQTGRAWVLKSIFQDLFVNTNRAEAEEDLKAWYQRAMRSRLKPMIAAAKTIKRHWEGILEFFRSRITNGFVEAINGLIQSAKRKSRGFRNPDYFITVIYLIAGKLKFDLPPVLPKS